MGNVSKHVRRKQSDSEPSTWMWSSSIQHYLNRWRAISWPSRDRLNKHHTSTSNSKDYMKQLDKCITLQKQKKSSKTNAVKISYRVNTPALSLKLSELITHAHKVSRAITGSYYFTPMQCKVASTSSRLFGTPSSFSLQPLWPLMATLGAFPSCSHKLKNWESRLKLSFPKICL